MAKDFRKNMQQSIGGGVDSLIPTGTPSTGGKPQRGRPRTQHKEISKTSEIGTKENETRATFIVNIDTLDKVKNIAYWDREDIKTVVGTALDDYVAQYEKKNGPVKPRRIKQK